MLALTAQPQQARARICQSQRSAVVSANSHFEREDAEVGGAERSNGDRVEVARIVILVPRFVDFGTRDSDGGDVVVSLRYVVEHEIIAGRWRGCILPGKIEGVRIGVPGKVHNR